MAGIFLSYRRQDSEATAGRLYDSLAARYGSERVFMDVDAIEPGLDYEVKIHEALEESAVLLVVIGEQWMTVVGEDGQVRLEHPDDLVRLEVSAALQRPDVRVIPILVGAARMPRSDELPESLQKLAKRNAIRLSHERWQPDVNRLVSALDRVLGAVRKPTSRKHPPPIKPREAKTPRPSVSAARRWAVVAVAFPLAAWLVVAAALGQSSTFRAFLLSTAVTAIPATAALAVWGMRERRGYVPAVVQWRASARVALFLAVALAVAAIDFGLAAALYSSVRQ